MDANEIRKILISNGYFPSELPPPFVTSHFAEQTDDLWKTWYRYKQPRTRPEFYSLARHGHYRRHLRIPNPVNQLFVSDVISKHWDDIKHHIHASPISLTKSEISKETSRAIKILPFKVLPERRVLTASSHRYILSTDITLFYSSVYTHTIPWALHGKAKAKKDHSPKSKTIWGNALDAALRNGNAGQTVGIPIGPDTSQIVAEIILSPVDQQVCHKLGDRLKSGLRYIDDVFLCFDTFEDAEAALAELSSATTEFELELNVGKTAILETIDHIEELWTHRLREISVSRKPTKQRSDILKFFSEAFALAKEHDDERIMKYALRTSTSVEVQEVNWDLYQGFLIRTALTYPNTIDLVAQILNAYSRSGYPLDNNKLSGLVSSIIMRHAQLKHHSEVAWALWAAKTLELPIFKEAAECLGSLDSGVCALLTLDNMDKGQITAGVDTSYWKSQLSDEGLSDKMWLLAYEADLKGWLKTKNRKFVDKSVFYSDLKSKDVSFYDEDAHKKPFGIAAYDYTPGKLKEDKEAVTSTAHASIFSGFNLKVAPYDDDTDVEIDIDEYL